MVNPGNLDLLCVVLVQSAERGEAMEVIEDGAWKEAEKMWLGRVKFGGKALTTANRDASSIERVYEGWARPVLKEGVRLLAEGITYKVERVDPSEGRQWVLIYCSVVK